jgi:hypothetical protein
MTDLQKRFESVARGRAVHIAERANTLFNNDYEVAFDDASNSYRVEFTRNGWFEGAHRFIERWIKRHAEELDGVPLKVPVGHADCRVEAMFWIIERFADCHIGDCQTALENQIKHLLSERPNEGVFGEVTVEARVNALRGVITHLQTITDEVHSGVLSPKSIEFLSLIGLDCFEPKKDSQPPVGGDSENRAADGAASGAPQP